MVKYHILLKIINNYIEKNNDWSGMTSSLPTRVKGKLNIFSKQIRGLDYEKGIVITDKGQIVQKKDGEKDNVKLPWSECDKEALQSHIGLNVEHNHPVYSDLEGFATCLSEWDCNNLTSLKPRVMDDDLNLIPNEDPSLDYEFAYKSVTADCGNGSRMTIAMVDEDKFKKKAYDKNGDSTKYRTLVRDFCGEDGHFSEFLEKATDDISDYMDKWTDKRVEKARVSGEDLQLQDLIDEANEEKIRYQKKYCQDNMPQFFKTDIENFNKMGVELTFGWLK